MVKRHTPFIHKNFLNVFLKNPQPGDSVRDVGAVALGLPEKIGVVLDVDKIEGQRYAFVRWIGYTEDSELTDDELTNIETKSPEWCSFLDLNIMVKAIEE
jgi:hypothetical protein|tara:strand:- start:7858 stop:8157 length:300 start_codon:yes stop_codon:yes gene_type:complete